MIYISLVVIYRWSTGHVILMFLLCTLTTFAQAVKSREEMEWEKNPEEAWPYTEHHYENRVVMLLLNERDEDKEWTFIASGVLLDNSRILTSYNPFRALLPDPKAEKIVALIPTGMIEKVTEVHIANIMCGRQIVYMIDEMNIASFWHDKEHCPIHDLMVLRMDEEFGIANVSYKTDKSLASPSFHEQGSWDWSGQLKATMNALVSFPAGLTDVIEPEIQIYTLGYMSEKQMKDFDTIHEITYEADDAALLDCDEWLPRQWGFFICIRNIGNFPGLSSGATLFSNHKLFGIGSFAMFKNDAGVLVFTDVRPYKELIEKTCGDEEFT